MTTCVHCKRGENEHYRISSGIFCDLELSRRFTPEEAMTDRTPEVRPEPQCACSVRERDSGHRTDCVYAAGWQESPAAVQPNQRCTCGKLRTEHEDGRWCSGDDDDTAQFSPATVQPEPACDEDCRRCSGEYCNIHSPLGEDCDCDVIDRHHVEPVPQPAGGVGERQERCVRCGNLVSQWVDTDWSNGRICLVCESIFAPESARVKIEQQPCSRCANLERELQASRQDIIAASGELLIPIPAIGTRESKLLYANCLMRQERDTLKAKVAELEQRIVIQHKALSVMQKFSSADRERLEVALRAALGEKEAG